MRSLDEPIPNEEPLYRGLLPTWIDGTHVLPDAVEVHGTSCNRGKYAPPSSVLSARFTRVAEITVGEFPASFPHPQTCELYQFFAQDCPETFNGVLNEAHMEIRLKAVDRVFSLNIRKAGVALRLDAQKRLADRFRLLPDRPGASQPAAEGGPRP